MRYLRVRRQKEPVKISRYYGYLGCSLVIPLHYRDRYFIDIIIFSPEFIFEVWRGPPNSMPLLY